VYACFTDLRFGYLLSIRTLFTLVRLIYDSRYVKIQLPKFNLFMYKLIFTIWSKRIKFTFWVFVQESRFMNM